MNLPKKSQRSFCRNTVLLIIFILCTTYTQIAIGQNTWTLKTCVDFGLKNNRSVTVYRNEKSMARAKAKEALAGYLPSVNITGTLDDNLKAQQSVIPAGVFGPEPTKVAFTQKYNPNIYGQLDQTIYDQSLLTGLKANRYNIEQAVTNEQQNTEALIYNISTDYYQVIIYREQLKLLKENLVTYDRQRQQLALKVEKGVTLESDMNKVIISYNNTLSQIATAESNIDQYTNQLKTDMGFPVASILDLDSIPPPVNAARFVQTDTPAVFNPANRVDYRLSEINTRLLEIDERRIRNGAYPKLTAYARYGGVGYGNEFGPSFTLSGYSAIGIKLTIPLLDFYKRNAQSSQARFKLLNAKENLQLDADKYTGEYNTIRTRLAKAGATLENDRGNMQLAHSNFDITDLQFQKGVTDLTDWLNAQYAVKEAESNYLTSLYKLYMNKLDLEKARGTLKLFYNSL